MKQKIEREFHKIISEQDHNMNLRLLMREVDTYVHMSEYKTDKVLRALLQHNNAELAGLLKLPIVVYNRKLKDFDFSTHELHTMIKHLKLNVT